MPSNKYFLEFSENFNAKINATMRNRNDNNSSRLLIFATTSVWIGWTTNNNVAANA